MSAQNENMQDSPWTNIPLEETKLGQIILRKLGEKQKKSNALFFLVSESGSKGDFIFREKDEEGIEFISIMFEMKNEVGHVGKYLFECGLVVTYHLGRYGVCF